VARELFTYRAGAYEIAAEGQPVCNCRALLIAIANTRQWGSGARIAPAALMDDERLDLVKVPAVPPVVLLAQVWRLFAGSVPGWSAVATQRIHAATIRCDPPAPAHVDGEPLGLLGTATIQVHPAALRVRVPRVR
jgi:diacylglycerol kinase family enzyme